jgi:hypothetical protein
MAKILNVFEKVGLNIVEYILEVLICTVFRLAEEHEFSV